MRRAADREAAVHREQRDQAEDWRHAHGGSNGGLVIIKYGEPGDPKLERALWKAIEAMSGVALSVARRT